MYEVGRIYQDIHTTATDKKNVVNVANEYFFKDLSGVYMEWALMLNGKLVKKGTINDLNVAPQQSAEITLPFNENDYAGKGELLLNVSYNLKENEGVLDAGYAVAKNHIAVSGEAVNGADVFAGNKHFNNVTAPLKVQENNRNFLIVSNGDFDVEFNKWNGYITTINKGGNEYMTEEAEIQPNFWRAATDNDFGASMQRKMVTWRNPRIELKGLNAEKDGENVVVKAN